MKEDRLYMGTEDQEQTTVISWCAVNEYRWPELKWIYHIPNGGKRSKSEAGRFRGLGVKAGVSDLCLPAARCGFHGLYIEMKTAGGTVSKEQKEFLAAVREQGYFGAVCYGADQAIKVLEMYLTGGVEE